MAAHWSRDRPDLAPPGQLIAFPSSLIPRRQWQLIGRAKGLGSRRQWQLIGRAKGLVSRRQWQLIGRAMSLVPRRPMAAHWSRDESGPAPPNGSSLVARWAWSRAANGTSCAARPRCAPRGNPLPSMARSELISFSTKIACQQAALADTAWAQGPATPGVLHHGSGPCARSAVQLSRRTLAGAVLRKFCLGATLGVLRIWSRGMALRGGGASPRRPCPARCRAVGRRRGRTLFAARWAPQ